MCLGGDCSAPAPAVSCWRCRSKPATSRSRHRSVACPMWCSSNAELNHVYVAVGDPGVIDVFDALALHRIATVKTGPGAHTIGFDAARNFVYAFLPESHAAAVYRAA